MERDHIKRIGVKEFREKGFLQEVNRKFFHPLGLALEITIKETGEEVLGGIWDYRDDGEGMFFGNNMISANKIEYVDSLRKSKIEFRKNVVDVKTDKDGIQQI